MTTVKLTRIDLAHTIFFQRLILSKYSLKPPLVNKINCSRKGKRLGCLSVQAYELPVYLVIQTRKVPY